MQNILIIEPSTSGLELLPTAHAMGLAVFVLTADQDERIIPKRYRQYIFKQIVVDTHDLSAMSDIVLALHHQYPLSAVIPGFELFVTHAASLSHLIQMPGIPPESSVALRDKSKMRNALINHGVRSPWFIILDEARKIDAVSKQIRFPCVIKPVDQSGSVHVSKVNNLDELIQAYHAMCRDPWTEMGKGIGTAALVEEYINGEEFSVEGYVEQQRTHVISITKKILGEEPFFVEMGHIVQANIDSKMRNSITKYVYSVIQAVNLTMGVFHCEIKIDANGPVLIEIAGRLAGGRICDLIKLAKTIDIYQIMIHSHMGLPIKINPNPILQYAGIYFFSLNGKDTFRIVNGIAEIQALPGFQEFTLLKQPGEIIPPLTSFLGRIAYCIFTAPTYEELITRLDHAASLITFL